jgi:cyclase
MPLAYGGGIRSIQEMQELFSIGIEKVVLNRQAADNPELISLAAERFGRQSVVVSMDAKKHRSGEYRIWTASGTRQTRHEVAEFAAYVERMGAGELLLTSIERDGAMNGYDLELIRLVADAVNIPVIACGGGGTLEHLHDAVIHGGASAVAAGSMFVFHGPHRAVLINFPPRSEIERLFHVGVFRSKR